MHYAKSALFILSLCVNGLLVVLTIWEPLLFSFFFFWQTHTSSRNLYAQAQSKNKVLQNVTFMEILHMTHPCWSLKSRVADACPLQSYPSILSKCASAPWFVKKKKEVQGGSFFLECIRKLCYCSFCNFQYIWGTFDIGPVGGSAGCQRQIQIVQMLVFDCLFLPSQSQLRLCLIACVHKSRMTLNLEHGNVASKHWHSHFIEHL